MHDPLWQHQAKSLETLLSDEASIIVTTGTGSGKTECFLLPLLGKLAVEAANQSESFAQPAVRAILMYPMNALVNDQLGRLRLLFGDDRIVAAFKRWGGRPARFARYTSRTLYPGVRTRERDQQRLRPIGNFYVNHLRSAMEEGVSPEEAAVARTLIEELQTRGKWPAKPDLLNWYGARNSRWMRGEEFVRCVTMPDDPELLTRHEVLEAPPDILVTNYSMLEFMMMRR